MLGPTGYGLARSAEVHNHTRAIWNVDLNALVASAPLKARAASLDKKQYFAAIYLVLSQYTLLRSSFKSSSWISATLKKSSLLAG
jgi:hypothetical protein